MWYNSNIKVGHRLVFYKELYEKNNIYVKDLLNKNNKFMCYNELKEKYKTKTNYLLFMGLIQAIPTKYKYILAKNIKYETQKKNIEKIVQRKEKVAKLICETKIERNKHFPEKAYQKIKTMFGIEISKELFLHYFTIAEAATTYNRLREFQYRILHSIVTTNITLKSWNIIDNDKCTFCQMEPDNLKHLLLHCYYSKIIWDHVKQLIQDISEITVQLSETETIIGISDSTDLKISNLVNMVIKQYIYACRCNKLLPSQLQQ